MDEAIGTKASFQEEALPHLDAVYRFALRLTGSRDGAQDLVQETFFRAYRAWDQYTPGTECKSWLFTICRNVFLRERARDRRHGEILEEIRAPGSGVGGTGLSIVNPLWQSAGEVDPEGTFFDAIVDAEILEAVDALPEEYRMAVVLSDLEGLSYEEIGRLLEVPLGTVKSRLFRGRRRLQQQLYEYAVEMGYLSPREGTDG